MDIRHRLWVCLWGVLLVPGLAHQVSGQWGSASKVVHAETVWQIPKANPGDQRVLAIILEIKDGYHINPSKGQIQENTDFIQLPSRLEVVETVAELTFETPVFPPPHSTVVDYGMGPVTLMAFNGRNIVYLPTKVTANAKPGIYRAKLKFFFQACTDTVCELPDVIEIPVRLEVVTNGTEVGHANVELFSGYQTRIEKIHFNLFGFEVNADASSLFGTLTVLILAGVGGLLLNLTPCVLPVIPIKITLLNQTAGSRRRCLILGLVMSLGVVAFWLGLGGLIAGVGTFNTTSALFQKPWFTIIVGAFIAVMATGICGLFTLHLPRFVYLVEPNQETLSGSFIFGLMTAVLSTPCTAPFMGTALGWATQQTVMMSLATFVSIGVGMALPYLILSSFPQCVAWIPRSGPISELVKQVMGLLMLATAAYFVGTGISALLPRAPDPPTRAYWWPVMLFVVLAGVWLIIRTMSMTRTATPRVIFCGLGILLVASGLYGGMRLTAKGPIDWQYYTPQRFEQALAADNVVLLDFTAEWCLNCKALEHGVLYTPQVVKAVANPDVVPMKVDITGQNPLGQQKLLDTGRLTIPLLVIYDRHGQEVFKGDTYTVSQVVQAIAKAQD